MDANAHDYQAAPATYPPSAHTTAAEGNAAEDAPLSPSNNNDNTGTYHNAYGELPSRHQAAGDGSTIDDQSKRRINKKTQRRLYWFVQPLPFC